MTLSKVKWNAFSRWSSLYFPKRISDQMTIGKMHPTLKSWRTNFFSSPKPFNIESRLKNFSSILLEIKNDNKMQFSELYMCDHFFFKNFWYSDSVHIRIQMLWRDFWWKMLSWNFKIGRLGYVEVQYWNRPQHDFSSK